MFVASTSPSAWAWPIAVCLIAASLCLPFIHTVWWFGDEGIWLSGALRLLHGRGLYTDTWAFHPPGGYLITAAWLSAFSTSFASARLLATASIAGTACLTYLTCQGVARHRPLAAAVSLAWVLMIQGFGFQLNHQYLTTCLAMLAACLSLAPGERAGRLTRRELGAFLCAGAATMITPNRGLLLAGSLVASMRRRPGAGTVCMRAAAFATAPLATLAYLSFHRALAAAYSDTIVFPLTRYASDQWVPFGWGASPQNLPLVWLFPAATAVAMLALLRCGHVLLADARYRFCVALAAAGFLGAYPRPDIFHLGSTAPLSLPLLCLGLTILASPMSRWWLGAATAATIACSLHALWTYKDLLADTRARISVPTVEGSIRLEANPPDPSVLISTLIAVPKTDGVFFYPYLMLMPYLTGHEQVGRNDVFVPGYTTPALYRESCVAMIRFADWVVVEKKWTDARFLQTTFPAMHTPNPPEKQALERAIQKYFTPFSENAAFDIRRRTIPDGPITRATEDQPCQ